MQATNRHTATLTLVAVSLGFAISYPFGYTFLGGLIASGCGSAMIGGLADWFAVSALFRRPLGIPFRTEIIARNRKRITESMINMVEGELFTRENIKETLNHYDIAALILRYLDEYDGKERLKEIAHRITRDLLRNINPEKWGAFLAQFTQANMASIRLAVPAGQAIAWTVEHGFFDRIVEFILGEIRALMRQPQVKTLLADLIAEAWVAYERHMLRRRLAGQFVSGLGITQAALAELVQYQAVAYLGELMKEEHPLRGRLRVGALAYGERLREDRELQKQFEEWKSGWLSGRPELEHFCRELVRTAVDMVAGEPNQPLIRRFVGSQIDRLVTLFHRDSGQQQALGRMVRQALTSLIDAHHGQIGYIVRDRLQRFSTESLVGFIEQRVGNDLQMIRINGSVVGGLVGAAIFLLMYRW
ncbi:MAG TPA: DUF445 domain-containing protein [Selenomonadales bacterium]|nr:DUF445 domain-containing protein [Selenomonadales bacterium]